MAYLEKPEDQQQQDPNAQGVLGSPGGGPLDPSAPAGGAPSAAGADAAGGARPQFAELDTYLQQNRPAAQQLGSRVAGAIMQRGDAARQAIQTGSQGFQSDVASRETPQDIGILNLLASDPVGLANDSSRREAFTKQRDASYSGPKQLEDTSFYAPISASVGEAKRYGDLSRTGSGISEILGSTADRPYSAGSRAFDASLAQGDPTAHGEIDQARSSLSDIDSRLADASQAARARAVQAQQTSEGTRQAAQGAISNAYAGQQSDLNQRLAAARAEAASRQQSAVSALQPKTAPLPQKGHGEADLRGFKQLVEQPQAAPSAQVLGDLGISPEQFAQFSDLSPVVQSATRAAKGTNNVNPYSYLDQYQSSLGDLGRFATLGNPESIQLGQVASPQDYARLGALNDLSGTPQNYLDPTQADQAGTANLDQTDFDFSSAMAQRQAALDEIRKRSSRQLANNSRNGSQTFLDYIGNDIG